MKGCMREKILIRIRSIIYYQNKYQLNIKNKNADFFNYHSIKKMTVEKKVRKIIKILEI